MKNRLRLAAAAIGLVAMVAGLQVAAAPAQAYPGSVQNCSGGVVCVYNGPGWTGPIIHAIAFGWENTSLNGTRRYLNNQSPGWWAEVCSQSGGNNCFYGFRAAPGVAWVAVDLNFDPVNSIRVSPP